MFGRKRILPVVPQVRRLTAANFISPAALKKGRTLVAVHTGYQNIHIFDKKAVCLKPALAIMGTIRFDHIYEHTHDQFPSYLKGFHSGTLVHSYFERNVKYFIPQVKGTDFVIIGGAYNLCHFYAFSHLLRQILHGIRANDSASITFPVFCIYDISSTKEVSRDTYDSFILNPRSNFSEYISYFKRAINMTNIELLSKNRPERIGWKIFIQNRSKITKGGPSKSNAFVTMNIVNDLGTLRELL